MSAVVSGVSELDFGGFAFREGFAIPTAYLVDLLLEEVQFGLHF